MSISSKTLLILSIFITFAYSFPVYAKKAQTEVETPAGVASVIGIELSVDYSEAAGVLQS